MGNRLQPSYAVPLLAVDRVVRLDPTQISARKAVAVNEPFFAGHYPDYPVYPGVFILETVHQAVRRYADAYHGPVHLVEVLSGRFLSAFTPGDVLECHCRFETIDEDGRLAVTATCWNGPTVAARLRLIYAIGVSHGA